MTAALEQNKLQLVPYAAKLPKCAKTGLRICLGDLLEFEVNSLFRFRDGSIPFTNCLSLQNVCYGIRVCWVEGLAWGVRKWWAQRASSSYLLFIQILILWEFSWQEIASRMRMRMFQGKRSLRWSTCSGGTHLFAIETAHGSLSESFRKPSLEPLFHKRPKELQLDGMS